MLSVAVSLVGRPRAGGRHRYSFERLLLADLAIAAVAALGARFRLRLGPRRSGPA